MGTRPLAFRGVRREYLLLPPNTKMTFWQENYSFIKEVYDTRYSKMVEWMDNVEMAIQKVCASKVYTSAEFKREKDNFQSLYKNLERAETKRWLTETLETLMKERAADEQKAESVKLKAVMERHKSLIPKIQETLVKTECYWKCYSYGDDLIPIFEFIDDLRNRSIKEVLSGNHEQTEEHIEKQDKVLNSLENKKRGVLDFLSKGEKLMKDPNCPKFLESHVQKLKEAWEDTNEKAQKRKKELTDNMSSWETFHEQTKESHRQLDLADEELASIKKVFDLSKNIATYETHKKTGATFRSTIEGLFNSVNNANNTIQLILPEDMKKEMTDQVDEIKKRTSVLDDTTAKLEYIDDFNKRLAVFNTSVTELEGWLAEGRKRIDAIVSPTADFSPEDRVTKTMEVQEDLRKKSDYTKKQENEREDIFPKGDEKVPSDAKKFNARLETVRKTMDSMDEEVKKECSKFSEDVKFWAEFQTGIKVFEPWIKKAEVRRSKGLVKPGTLVDACTSLGDCKNFQDECEAKMKVLEEAQGSAGKMSCHNEADDKVQSLKGRWDKVYETAKEWVEKMTTLVECWNKLEGNVDELSSWVNIEDGSKKDVLGCEDHISIEKLEGQLNQLKAMFAEKQKLVTELDACGPIEHNASEAHEAHTISSE